MPAALQRLGLHDTLGASYAGNVDPPPYIPQRDPRSRVRNTGGIAKYSADLATATAALLRDDAFPLVLGGDCSILLGVAPALHAAGRFGLLYLDAHSDCQTPATSGTGGVAGMPLAMVTGLTPGIADDLLGRGPLIAQADTVLLGCRDLFDIVPVAGGSRVAGSDIAVHDLEEIRRSGARAVAMRALESLERRGIAQAWIHLDADVLDAEVMPAVDSPDPGGLSEDELGTILEVLLGAELVRGMHLTIYDPERDPDGAAGMLLVRVLRRAFGR